MATAVANPNFPFRMDQVDISSLNYGTVLSESSTQVVINEGEGFVATLNGYGVVYDGFGDVQGGTMTGLSEAYNGSTIYTLTGLNLSAVDFANWMARGQTSLALQAGLAGNDAITGSNFGDYINAYGGEDNIRAGTGADTIFGGAGSDTFSGTMAELNGDAIYDFNRGDRIIVSGLQASHASVSLSSGILTITGDGSTIRMAAYGLGSVATGVGPSGELVISQKVTTDGLGDLNGDGRADFLWRNSNGAVSTWLDVSGTYGEGIQQSVFNSSVDTGWTILDTFDWNGDGKSDILWRHSNGTMSIWSSNGTSFNAGSYTNGSVGNDWRIAGEGDFNGDGKDDLLWQYKDGSISTWSSSGSGFVANTYFHGSPGSDWHVVQTADFTGDGKDDILWRSTSGAISIWDSTGSSFQEGSFFDGSVGMDWRIVGSGDFNGDGREDLLWRNGSQTIIWEASSGGFDRNTFYDNSVPSSWKVAAVEDLNADGKADIIWRNDNGSVSTWVSNGSGFVESAYNASVPSSWSVVGHDFGFG